jgi:hypothetical protein
MEQAVIDRIENGIAVVLIGEAERQVNVPREQLPKGAREGAWLKVEMAADQIVRIELDREATEAARKRIAEKLEKLRRGEHLK